jgi:trimethylamine:corrinoid methyltransferase-like protein
LAYKNKERSKRIKELFKERNIYGVVYFKREYWPTLNIEGGKKMAKSGENFLTSSLTLKHFRSAYYSSDIWPNLSLEAWQAKNRPQPTALLRDYTREILAKLQPPADHADLLARGEAFITSIRDKHL